jgi:FkbM family methyltransferase
VPFTQEFKVIVDTNTAKMIHDSLADDLSKRIFNKRLAYSMVDSMENLRELARFHIPEFIDKVMAFVERGYKVCVYGVGNGSSMWHPGRFALTLFNDHLAENGVFDKQAEQLNEIQYIFRTGTKAQIKVSPPDQIRNLDSNTVIIVAPLSSTFQYEITEYLLYLGIPLNRILFFPTSYYAVPKDYFCHPFWKFGPEEVFIDGGCFDGADSRQFLDVAKRHTNASVSKIIAYEPDEKSFNVCRKNMADLPFFFIKNAGLWNKSETLRFLAIGRWGSCIQPAGNTDINAVSLDEELAGQRVTFIKMDIEGAELNALKGAETTIRNQRPKLAICVYHKPEDIITIPEFIINLDINYKLYLRHQTLYSSDTVLYAVPQ